MGKEHVPTEEEKRKLERIREERERRCADFREKREAERTRDEKELQERLAAIEITRPDEMSNGSGKRSPVPQPAGKPPEKPAFNPAEYLRQLRNEVPPYLHRLRGTFPDKFAVDEEIERRINERMYGEKDPDRKEALKGARDLLKSVDSEGRHRKVR